MNCTKNNDAMYGSKNKDEMHCKKNKDAMYCTQNNDAMNCMQNQRQQFLSFIAKSVWKLDWKYQQSPLIDALGAEKQDKRT